MWYIGLTACDVIYFKTYIILYASYKAQRMPKLVDVKQT